MTDMFVFRWKPTVVVGITSQTTMRSAEALFEKKINYKILNKNCRSMEHPH